MRFIPPGGESGCCQVHWSDGSRRSGHFRGVLMVREREPGSIVIVGSLNADLTVQTARFPQPGETVSGGDLTVLPGGKGANQAVAAARLGGKVRMIGAVGDDSNGNLLLRSLTRAGVDTSQVEIKTGLPTGTAVILVDETGENIIVVSPGANGALSPADVTAGMFVGASGVGLCLEIPVETVMRAAVMAKQAGATVLTNLSPYQAVPGELLDNTDILLVNEHEAAQLGEHRVARTIITRGEAGATVIEDDSPPVDIPAISVETVDTTGCGDAFMGAVLQQLAAGASLVAAARYAAGVGAFAATRRGAQASYPDAARMNSFLAGHS